jgi:hypothetical protein
VPTVTEKEIYLDRESIALRLHTAYLNLTDEMAEFQQQWDANPAFAFINSAREGWNAGGASWLDDQAELFEKKTWVDMGNRIGSFAGDAYDRLYDYTQARFQEIAADVNEHLDDPEKTLGNYAWWQAQLQAKLEQLAATEVRRFQELNKAIAGIGHSVLNVAATSKKIYKHRQAIMGLPKLIAHGDPKPIERFVDVVLMDIDPQLAKDIRKDPNYYAVLEILSDHDSALTYLAYASLMIEAIPPNFYAYVAGKGAAYLVIEIIMLIVSALLSAGAAAATRITLLLARFATAGVHAVQVTRRIQRARAAIAAFIRAIEELSQAATDLHYLGKKLNIARGKGYVFKGKTRTTIDAKRKAVTRDQRCRRCGSTSHTTPRTRLGVVTYD